MALSVLHHGTGCYSYFWGWALTSNLFFSCLLCLQCHVSVTSNISQHSDTFEPSWVQTLLILNAFMPCPAQLSAFLRQDRSLACVRSRPSFLSIRTTIKEAVCFILESHNWHLHIGSWNRGSSQRSQGIWQSEQFSHREQGIFALHTSLQLLALWNHNSTWGQGGVGMRQRSYWKPDLRPPSPVWREAAVWMFIWAVSKTLFTFLTTLKSLSRLLSRRSHRKLMNAWLMAVDLWWKEAVASSIWVHSSVIRAADCRSAGPLSRPAFWLSRNKQR